MQYEDFEAIRVNIREGVAYVTIDNAPVNVEDARLVADLSRFARVVQSDEGVRVIVFQSANPEFFAAHADNNWMFDPAGLMALADPEADPALNPLQQLHERLRNLPQITIAKLRGRLRAGGAEFAMTADMRFAAAGETWLSQPESLMGIFPGGGGTQYLNRLVGRARGLEIALSGELYDSATAERYGWINREIPGQYLDVWVDSIARRIALLPKGVAAAAKEAFDAAEASGPVPDLAEEARAHAKVYPSPQAVVDRVEVLMSHGGQQRVAELNLEESLRSIPWPSAE
ncbi:enoyl-CoA hydratase/carnithine racemase [Diaminobutyricimonas aerilata]|uniref:Enoyl-CoA hydratase/carnithine racemase n=2 Tax=Diaminobutyricimonas aerilata TaxID=1162967 RepID=A0A2M9CP05_9MICO|nr:enoyl-CoA hydratase/carnithine racemase [Diaminobutyricimonas aerilata]